MSKFGNTNSKNWLNGTLANNKSLWPWNQAFCIIVHPEKYLMVVFQCGTVGWIQEGCLECQITIYYKIMLDIAPSPCPANEAHPYFTNPNFHMKFSPFISALWARGRGRRTRVHKINRFYKFKSKFKEYKFKIFSWNQPLYDRACMRAHARPCKAELYSAQLRLTGSQNQPTPYLGITLGFI